TRWQSLTPRETEVFHLTVAGLLNKQAAAELGIAQNTYQVHRGRVMRKMKAQSLADLVRMATTLESTLRNPCQDEVVVPQPRWSLEEPLTIGRATVAQGGVAFSKDGMDRRTGLAYH